LKLWKQGKRIRTVRKMETIRATQKKYCTGAMTLSIIVCLFCILAGWIPVGKGLVLGTMFSILNFILMGETLPYRLGRSKKKTFFTALGSIYFRYVILAIPLVVAIKFEQFSLFSVIVGIFAVQVVLLADHLQGFIKNRFQKKV
jgi:CDP-diglyceride synthetase